MAHYFLMQFLLLGFASGHPSSSSHSPTGKVYTADVYIPSVRNDDQYYNVDVNFNGQILPVMVDTGSADIMVVADTCNVVSNTSGCYLCDTYKTKGTKLVEPFGTTVGVGTATGNTTTIPVTLGGLKVDRMSTPLIDYAVAGEFQQGSFSGIIGLGPRNVSRNYYFNGHLPLIDEMIKRNLLEKPLFSLSLPRMGDPQSPKRGKLTLGAVQGLVPGNSLTFNDIIDSPNYNYDGKPLSPQSWTAELQAIRINGRLVNVTRGNIDPKGRYMSLMDSGSQQILLRYDEFTAVAKAFKGKKVIQDGHAIYFDCSVPQLLELKYHDRWFAVDPLDLIIPSDHGVSKGVDLCHAALGVWDRSLADSIVGVPFLRNVVSVYDYVDATMYKFQPRFGLSSTTDGAKAVKRYSQVYKNRLRST